MSINPETVEFLFLGNIGLDSDLYNIVFNYIRKVSFGSNGTNFVYSNLEQKPKYGYNHYSLLNSF